MVEASSFTDLTPRITARPFGRHGVCLELDGELDLASAPLLQEAMGAAIDDGDRHFVFDLSGTLLLDCACLGAILQGMRPLRTEEDAALVLAGASGMVERLLTLVGFDRLCPIVSTVPTATAVALGSTGAGSEGWRGTGAGRVSVGHDLN